MIKHFFKSFLQLFLVKLSNRTFQPFLDFISVIGGEVPEQGAVLDTLLAFPRFELNKFS